MSQPLIHSVRLEQRIGRLHDRLGRACVELLALDPVARCQPVSPAQMAAAAALCARARRLLSRHPDAAAVPELAAAPPLPAGDVFVALAVTQRIVLTISLSLHDLSPEPWEEL